MGYSGGVDTVARCSLWDVRNAIAGLPHFQRLAIREDIGTPCDSEHRERERPKRLARSPEEARQVFTSYMQRDGWHFHVRLTCSKEVLEEAWAEVVAHCVGVKYS